MEAGPTDAEPVTLTPVVMEDDSGRQMEHAGEGYPSHCLRH